MRCCYYAYLLACVPEHYLKPVPLEEVFREHAEGFLCEALVTTEMQFKEKLTHA